MALESVSTSLAFAGKLIKYKFQSPVLGNTEAKFNLFLPIGADTKPVPVLLYLAGLTCNEDTGPWKGGFLRDAAEHNIAMIFPDTSPRGAGIEGETDDWDFGVGAGFYLDATHEKFKKHYNMLSHVTKEIPDVLKQANVPIDWSRQSIFGHSMGGHGAITLYLRNLELYRSASAFAPVSNPTKSPWGIKAFGGFLSDPSQGKEYDATELIAKTGGKKVNVLIDYGDGDRFYKDGQLLPENFSAAAQKAGFREDQVRVRLHPGYDHSYYFISTFGPEHVKYHAHFLNA